MNRKDISHLVSIVNYAGVAFACCWLISGCHTDPKGGLQSGESSRPNLQRKLEAFKGQSAV
jgi:hypothetical protein